MSLFDNPPDIKLITVIKCIESTLFIASNNNEYLHELRDNLDFYVWISDIAKISSHINNEFKQLSKKLHCRCKINISHPTDGYYDGCQPKVYLTINEMSGNSLSEYINWSVEPIVTQINFNNYIEHAFINLYDLINYFHTIGLEFDIFMLSTIMEEDEGFRINYLNNHENNLSLFQNQYRKVFGFISDELFNEAFELAYYFFDSISGLAKESNKNKSSEISKESTREIDNLYKIIGLLSTALITKSGNSLLNSGKPNISAIVSSLERHLPKDQTGLSERSLREKIKKGLECLEDLKSMTN